MAERLKAERENKGLSLRALAELSGVTNGAIHMIETGQRSPSLYNVARLADALGVCVSDLIASAERDSSD